MRLSKTRARAHSRAHPLPPPPLHARAQTFVVGEVDEDSKKLVKVSHDCLAKAIAMCKPGVRFRDIGEVITKHAHANGCVRPAWSRAGRCAD